MKILYVITSSDVGGAENALASLVRVVKARHTVKIICLKPLECVAKQLIEEGVDVVSLNMQGSGLGIVSKLVREIEIFKPDIVHAMLFRAIEFSRLACAGRSVKLITTPHFDLSQKPLWMRWLDCILKNIDTVSTAESVSTYNYLTGPQHYKKSKTLFIGNSVEKSKFFRDASIKKTMRQTHHFMEEDIIFISTARLAPVKNPLGLLSSFSKILSSCPHAKLIYVGEGGERAKLEQQIKALNLEKQVFVVGEQKNINDWLNMADVFVLFSMEESLPLALLEAQQVGLPCLVSNVGDMPRQIIHGKNGFVCKTGDVLLLACMLTELYENKSMREKMGSYSLQKTATIIDSSQQYQQLYQQIMGK